MADQVFTSFKPTFSPSKLTDYFGRVHEKNEVILVLKHFPNYNSNEKIRKNASNIPSEYKNIIKEEVEKSIDRKSLMFDDESAKRNIQERIQESTKTAQNNYAYSTNKQTNINEKPLIVDDNKHAANINPFSNQIEDNETETETEHEEESDYNDNTLPKINLKSYISKQASFSRGKKMEQPTINKVNENYEKSFKKCSNYIERDLGSFYLYGRPDGIDEQNRLIVEIKTTTNLKLNNQNEIILDKKTRIQCLCYLKLTGFNTCWCVHLSSDGTLIKTEIVFDENEFDELVVSKLNAIVDKYRNMSEQDFIGLVNKYFAK